MLKGGCGKSFDQVHSLGRIKNSVGVQGACRRAVQIILLSAGRCPKDPICQFIGNSFGIRQVELIT